MRRRPSPCSSRSRRRWRWTPRRRTGLAACGRVLGPRPARRCGLPARAWPTRSGPGSRAGAWGRAALRVLDRVVRRADRGLGRAPAAPVRRDEQPAADAGMEPVLRDPPAAPGRLPRLAAAASSSSTALPGGRTLLEGTTLVLSTASGRPATGGSGRTRSSTGSTSEYCGTSRTSRRATRIDFRVAEQTLKSRRRSRSSTRPVGRWPGASDQRWRT